MSGVGRIAVERARQVAAEGHSAILDRERHKHGQLARAAACYALSSTNEGADRQTFVPSGWPWPHAQWKPRSQVRDLERAGALIAAELDRVAGTGITLPELAPEKIIEMEIYKGAEGKTAAERNAQLARYIVRALRKAGWLT